MQLSMSSAVVSRLPTSTTNITGFFTIQRGLSLRTESTSACVTIFASHNLFFSDIASCFLSSLSLVPCLEQPPCFQQQVLQNRPQAERREECKRTQNQHHADQQRGKERCVHREGSRRRRHALLLRQIARQRQHGNHHQEAPDEHVPAERNVVPPCVGVQSGECRAVVACAGGEGVENLAEAVRAGVVQA